MGQKEQIDTTKLLPFDIEKAKQGAKVVTREGKISYDKIGTEYPIVALVNTGNIEMVFSFTEKGYHNSDEQPHPNDLFLLPETKTMEGWVNIYKAVNTGHFFSDGNIYASKEEAKDFCSNPFATIKIQWEEK